MHLQKSAKWDIIDRCNLRCTHCSVADRYFTATDKPAPLTAADRRRIAMALINGGVRHISILGGEPFLLGEELFDLLRLYKSHGLSISLVTNGLLIDEPAMEELVRIGPDRLVFSMEGPEPAAHDQIRGQGNFRRLIRVITELRARIGKRNSGPALHINTVVTRRNMHLIPQMIPHALAIGADELSLLGLNCVGNAARQQNQLALSADDELTVARAVADIYASKDHQRLRLNMNFIYPLVRDYLLVHESRRLPFPQICCGAASTLAYLNPWGEMHPCDRIFISRHDRRFRSEAEPSDHCDLTRNGFFDAWNSEYFLNTFSFVASEAAYRSYDPCLRCNYFHLKKCTPCPLDAMETSRFPIESCLRVEGMASSGIPALIARASELDSPDLAAKSAPTAVPAPREAATMAITLPTTPIFAQKGVRLAHLKATDRYILIHPCSGESLFLNENGYKLWDIIKTCPQTPVDICRRYDQEVAAVTAGTAWKELSPTIKQNTETMIRTLLAKQFLHC